MDGRAREESWEAMARCPLCRGEGEVVVHPGEPPGALPGLQRQWPPRGLGVDDQLIRTGDHPLHRDAERMLGDAAELSLDGCGQLERPSGMLRSRRGGSVLEGGHGVRHEHCCDRRRL